MQWTEKGRLKVPAIFFDALLPPLRQLVDALPEEVDFGSLPWQPWFVNYRWCITGREKGGVEGSEGHLQSHTDNDPQEGGREMTAGRWRAILIRVGREWNVSLGRHWKLKGGWNWWRRGDTGKWARWVRWRDGPWKKRSIGDRQRREWLRRKMTRRMTRWILKRGIIRKT